MGVWEQHLRNTDALSTYAAAMCQLANQHWNPAEGSRIHWCHRAVLEYFREGGRTKALAKDARRLAYQQAARIEERQQQQHLGSQQQQQHPGSQQQQQQQQHPGSQQQHHAGSQQQQQQQHPGSQQQQHYVAHVGCIPSPASGSFAAALPEAANDSLEETPVKRAKLQPLLLLDVGSCFDPFAVFDDFKTLAIDIAPACSQVHRVDFLTVPILERTPAREDSDGDPRATAAPVTALQVGAYDVVVFSLLLSYMPTPRLRFRACERARAVLRETGLLVVMAPDSNHLGRGVQWMKGWKMAIESLGFRRCKYEKLKNLHCMAFRAVPVAPPGDTVATVEAMQALMTIPQDGTAATGGKSAGE